MLLLVSAITFCLVNLAPGGPSSLMRMDATAEQREALTRRLGLDQPVIVRYFQWLGGAVHGDLGVSLSSNEPVAQRIGQRLPNTLVLSGRSPGVLDPRRHSVGRARRASPQLAARLPDRAGERRRACRSRRSGSASC